MENQFEMPESIQLTGQSENFLVTAARWAKFLGILGYIFAGFMVVMSIGIGFIINSFAAQSHMGPQFSPFLLTVVYLICSAIYFVMAYFLVAFGSNTQKAIASRNTMQLEEGLRMLKTHFTIIGVFAIIGLALMVLSIFIAIIVGTLGALAL